MSDEELFKLISDILKNEPNLLTRLMLFLSDPKNEQFKDSIKFMQKHNPNNLESFVREMAQDALKSTEDPVYIETMRIIYDNYLKGKDLELSDFHFEIDKFTDKTIQFNMLKAISSLDNETRASLVKNIAAICEATNFGILSKYVNGAISQIASSKYAGEALLFAFLAKEAYDSIRDWYQGKITGKRCTKQIIDSIYSAAGGYIGGSLGMAAGAALGPTGLVIGAIVGGLIGSNVVGNFSKWLTSELFDLPRDVGVENAFKFMGINHKSTNQEINRRFRELCLKYHPDKGGSNEQFHQLQVSMAVIKCARGEVA